MAIDGARDYGTVAIEKGADIAATGLTAAAVHPAAYALPKIDDIKKIIITYYLLLYQQSSLFIIHFIIN